MSHNSLPAFPTEFFLTASDEEVLLLVRDEFAAELEGLKGAYSYRDSKGPTPLTRSPSQILFGAEHDEVNRTLVGILALRWIYHGQYDTFVRGQAAAVRLSRASFSWVSGYFASYILEHGQTLYALVTSLIINDLGKSPRLAETYQEHVGVDISSLNHDAILLKAAEARLVPCLDRLTSADREAVMQGLQLGAKFNFGQLAQAENVPASLSALVDMRGAEYAFRLHFMEQLLDIAGAAGHQDWTCAKKLIEPILKAYQSVYDVATALITTPSLSVRAGYDRVLVNRAKTLQSKGFRPLFVDNPVDRALMRLLCMGGVADVDSASLFDAVWHTIPAATKNVLIGALNRDGVPGELAVQPTYMPALLTQAVDINGPWTQQEKMEALQSALYYLSRVMTVTGGWEASVIVIERNVLTVLVEVVQSSTFRKDVTVLEKAAVPEGTVCQSTE